MADSHAVHQNWSFPVNTKWQYNVSRSPSLHRLKIYKYYMLITMPHLTSSSYVEPTCTGPHPLAVNYPVLQYNISSYTP